MRAKPKSTARFPLRKLTLEELIEGLADNPWRLTRPPHQLSELSHLSDAERLAVIREARQRRRERTESSL